MGLSLVDAGPIAQELFGLVDSLFTSEEERMAAKLKLMELEKVGELAQITLNTAEAQHQSIFVAGWRPFIGWTCGAAFVWAFVLSPFIQFGLVAVGADLDVARLPTLDLSVMLPVLMGMLGLGAMRSYERSNGVERNSMRGHIDRRAKG